ncbi:hypothetical protein Salat_2981600 [Sesamum alatum]|uniref:Uncharacterized protein n=1 Tax=Sesamum alatum TaxID=300844 RepID=A0AAE1XI48_9LAMI|nr:hypothetical protein Salat_2981600 [Sesamum alatum]
MLLPSPRESLFFLVYINDSPLIWVKKRTKGKERSLGQGRIPIRMPRKFREAFFNKEFLRPVRNRTTFGVKGRPFSFILSPQRCGPLGVGSARQVYRGEAFGRYSLIVAFSTSGSSEGLCLRGTLKALQPLELVDSRLVSPSRSLIDIFRFSVSSDEQL